MVAYWRSGGDGALLGGGGEPGSPKGIPGLPATVLPSVVQHKGFRFFCACPLLTNLKGRERIDPTRGLGRTTLPSD